MNPFEAYAKAAHSRINQPQKLIGVTKTRAAARERYVEMIGEIRACEDAETLEIFVISITADIAQFKAELPFLWEGDGDDFLGLEREIERRFEEFRAEPESAAERILGF